MSHWLKRLGLLMATVVALALAASFGVQSDAPEISFDGLHLQKNKHVAALYIKPEAEFDVYTRFMMLDTYVAFKKNWQRDTRVAGRRVSNKDMEKIKTEAASLLREAFQEEMEADGGYPMVEQPAENVLLLRPAIIDLDITAPDIPVAGRVSNYVASSGAATLYLELYDSVSGEILARIVDRKAMRDRGYMQWSTSVSNRADAKRLFKRWADFLRKGLDEVHEEKYKAGLEAP